VHLEKSVYGLTELVFYYGPMGQLSVKSSRVKLKKSLPEVEALITRSPENIQTKGDTWPPLKFAVTSLKKLHPNRSTDFAVMRRYALQFVCLIISKSARMTRKCIEHKYSASYVPSTLKTRAETKVILGVKFTLFLSNFNQN
jgi:hypothetical protein